MRPPKFPLIFISLFTLSIFFADGIMSYTSPIYIESVLKNPKYMGLVFATSSAIGILYDFLAGSQKGQKHFALYLFGSAVLGLLFPLTLLIFKPNIISLVLAMGIWGIYYEMIRFGRFQFIPHFFTKSLHPTLWGVVTILGALSISIAPPVASFTISTGFKNTFLLTIPFYIFAGLITIPFLRHKGKKETVLTPTLDIKSEEKEIKYSIKSSIILTRKIWPILLFIFTLTVIDSSFWTIGTLLSENIKSHGPGLLLSLYTIPTLFMGLLTAKLGRPFGKKRAAFISGAIASFFLISLSQIKNPNQILAIVFISSVFISIAWPEIYAVFEDFIARSKEANEIVSIQGLSINLGYVLGPIFAGFVSSLLGFEQTFAAMGIMLLISSILALLIIPRKVRLPEKKLEEISL